MRTPRKDFKLGDVMGGMVILISLAHGFHDRLATEADVRLPRIQGRALPASETNLSELVRLGDGGYNCGQYRRCLGHI